MKQQIVLLQTDPAVQPSVYLHYRTNNTGMFNVITLTASLLWLSVHEWTMSQLLIADAASNERAGEKQPNAENLFPSCAVGGADAPCRGSQTGARARHFQLTKITMVAPATRRPCAQEDSFFFCFFFAFTVCNLFTVY